MLGFLDRIKKVAACEANILIEGDPGVGSECIALLLHQQSPRSEEPFLARSCTAIPPDCFESEMFGYSLKSPHGEESHGCGAFLEADKGTLFLDEIGDLGYSQQTEILMAIKQKIIHPVGTEANVRVNPRIICSTTRDLRECIKLNRFRDDLYYSTAIVVLTLQPLREQRQDIIPLARYYAGRASKWLRTLTIEAENRLLAYDWPGNIRELRATMEQAVLLAAGQAIQADELNFPTKTYHLNGSSRLLADIQRKHILSVIKICNGNKTDAARALGVARSTLVLKLKTISAAQPALS